MAYAMTKQGSLDNCVTYEFICDTVEDMNAIEDRYRTIGTVAIVLSGASGLEVYIAGSDKQWNSLSSIGGSAASDTAGLSIYICAQDEVSEGLPDIESPDEQTLYLVPAAEPDSGNLYDEYIYVEGEWEKFGSSSTTIDLSGYYQKPVNGIPAADLASGVVPDVSGFAPKDSPVFTGSISLGRKADTTVGNSSVAIGSKVIASGLYSYAEGYDTAASGEYAHSEGAFTFAFGESAHAEGNHAMALGDISHAEGMRTYANGFAEHASGQFNITSYAPEWKSGTLYNEGDLVFRRENTSHGQHEVFYKCKIANSDTTFYSSKWEMSGKYLITVGNGTEELKRSNAYALDWDGNGYFNGNIYINCNYQGQNGIQVATETDINMLLNRIIALENKVAYLENQHIPETAVTDESGNQVTDESSNFITYNNLTN